MSRVIRSAFALVGLLACGSISAEVITYEARGYIATTQSSQEPDAQVPAEANVGNFRLVFQLDLDAPYGAPDAGGGAFDAVRSFGYWRNDGPGGAYASHVQYDGSNGVSSVFVTQQSVSGDPSHEREAATVTVVANSTDGAEWRFDLKAEADRLALFETEYEMPDLTVFPAETLQLKVAARDGSGRVAYGRVTSLHRFYPQDQLASYIEPFADENSLRSWKFVGGQWTASGGTLRSLDNVYNSIALNDRPLQKDDFKYSVRLRSGWGASGNVLGAVYNYVDDRNYYYVQLSPTGVAKLNRVLNGTTEMISTSSYAGAGAKVWVNVGITKSAGRTTVTINGTPTFSNVVQSELHRGRVGVFTRFNPSQFDDVYLNQGFIEHDLFDLSQSNALVHTGTWNIPAVMPSVTSATSNQSSAILLVNQPLKANYQHTALVYSPWSGSGNVAGLVYDFVDAANYKEIRLSPSGSLKAYRVTNNVRTIAANGLWAGGSKKWVHVSVARFDGYTTVSVDGNLHLMFNQSNVANTRVGVLSGWNLARFAYVTPGQLIDQ